jgi:hypothetical protein
MMSFERQVDGRFANTKQDFAKKMELEIENKIFTANMSPDNGTRNEISVRDQNSVDSRDNSSATKTSKQLYHRTSIAPIEIKRVRKMLVSPLVRDLDSP